MPRPQHATSPAWSGLPSGMSRIIYVIWSDPCVAGASDSWSSPPSVSPAASRSRIVSVTAIRDRDAVPNVTVGASLFPSSTSSARTEDAAVFAAAIVLLVGPASSFLATDRVPATPIVGRPTMESSRSAAGAQTE